MGIAGACRGHELYEMKLRNVKEINAIIIVNTPDSKNEMIRTYTITASERNKCRYLQIVKKYNNIVSKLQVNVFLWVILKGDIIINLSTKTQSLKHLVR